MFQPENLSVIMIMTDYTAKEVSALCQGFVYQPNPSPSPSVGQPQQSSLADQVWVHGHDETLLRLQDELAEGGQKQVEYDVGVQDKIESECARIKVKDKENTFHVCDKCGKSFHNLKLYNVHVYQIHPENYPHQCLICPKKYAHNFQLTKHVKNDHATVSFKCQYCHRLYKSKRALANHCKINHSC